MNSTDEDPLVMFSPPVMWESEGATWMKQLHFSTGLPISLSIDLQGLSMRGEGTRQSTVQIWLAEIATTLGVLLIITWSTIQPSTIPCAEIESLPSLVVFLSRVRCRRSAFNRHFLVDELELQGSFIIIFYGIDDLSQNKHICTYLWRSSLGTNLKLVGSIFIFVTTASSPRQIGRTQPIFELQFYYCYY